MADTPLGERAWTELDVPAADAPVIVVPVGSFEQHGPHLPLDTDTRIAIALAAALCAGAVECVLGPALTVTASGEHRGFPGTLSIGAASTEMVLVELARSADWAGGVVFVNGHGGNAVALQRAAATLHEEGRRALFWSPRVPRGDLHAGRTETSLLLHLAPEVVRLGAAVAGPQPSLRELVEHGVRPLSPTGVLGDPAGASAGEGAALFAALSAELLAAFHAWQQRNSPRTSGPGLREPTP